MQMRATHGDAFTLIGDQMTAGGATQVAPIAAALPQPPRLARDDPLQMRSLQAGQPAGGATGGARDALLSLRTFHSGIVTATAAARYPMSMRTPMTATTAAKIRRSAGVDMLWATRAPSGASSTLVLATAATAGQ